MYKAQWLYVQYSHACILAAADNYLGIVRKLYRMPVHSNLLDAMMTTTTTRG
jgi:hypothetical protein